jgi:hypothetical protein
MDEKGHRVKKHIIKAPYKSALVFSIVLYSNLLFFSPSKRVKNMSLQNLPGELHLPFYISCLRHTNVLIHYRLKN